MTRPVRHQALWLFGCLLFACTIGCGDSGVTSGFVKFVEDGSPVTGGSVEFRRESDTKRFAGRISPDGTFELMDENGKVGLPPGRYDVVVVQIVLTEDLAMMHHTHGLTVAKKYADYYSSDLKAEVSEGQMDPVEIIVEAEPEPEETPYTITQ